MLDHRRRRAGPKKYSVLSLCNVEAAHERPARRGNGGLGYLVDMEPKRSGGSSIRRARHLAQQWVDAQTEVRKAMLQCFEDLRGLHLTAKRTAAIALRIARGRLGK